MDTPLNIGVSSFRRFSDMAAHGGKFAIYELKRISTLAVMRCSTSPIESKAETEKINDASGSQV